MRRIMIWGRLFFLFLIGVYLTGCSEVATSTDHRIPSVTGNCIHAQAVVRYFLSDGNQYFTEQQHLFCPSEKTLQIQSNEPAGFHTWRITEHGFNTTSSTGNHSRKETSLMNHPAALSIFSGFYYGSEILDTSSFMKQDPQKIEGQWYEPFQQASLEESVISILYQNLDSKKIDFVTVTDQANGITLSAKCYNWRYFGPDGTLIPRTIDIFDISQGLSSKNLLIRVDYKHIE